MDTARRQALEAELTKRYGSNNWHIDEHGSVMVRTAPHQVEPYEFDYVGGLETAALLLRL